MGKSKDGASIEALFGVGDIEAGEDAGLASDVRNAAASFLAALSKPKKLKKRSAATDEGAADDTAETDAAAAAKKEKARMAAFWNERAIARGEKKKPKAPVEPAAEPVAAPEVKKKRVKPGKAERAALRKEREAQTSQAALSGKKRAAKSAAPKAKARGGLFAADDGMWDE